MSLDPELQVVVDLVNAQPAPPAAEQGAEGLRAAFAMLATMLGSGDEAVSSEDLRMALPGRSVAARRYLPAEPSAGAGTVVWYHGGGFVIGSIDTHDAICRDLAAACGWPVVSVDYRLAPEHPFPAAHDDAEAAVRWLAAHGADHGLDMGRTVLAGDSAGANLAIATARRLRDDPEPGVEVVLAALVYPVADLADPDSHPSYTDNGEGYLLTAETMRFFADSYVPDAAQRATDDASPLRAGDLSGLPATLVITAEYDPLRDEGDELARALSDAGVAVELERFDGAVHMALQLVGTSVGQRMRDVVARAIRSTASRSNPSRSTVS
jgi:acetyl esterase